MFGLLASLLTGAICAKESLSESMQTAEFKQKSLERGDLTYIDTHGREYRCDNNHPVYRCFENGNYLIKDAKTDQVILFKESYQNRVKRENQEKIEEALSQNEINKAEAIKNGDKHYFVNKVRKSRIYPFDDEIYQVVKEVGNDNVELSLWKGQLLYMEDHTFVGYLNDEKFTNKSHPYSVYEYYMIDVRYNIKHNNYTVLPELTYEEWCRKYLIKE